MGAGDKKQDSAYCKGNSKQVHSATKLANLAISRLAVVEPELSPQQVLDELNADTTLVGHVADLEHVTSHLRRARGNAAKKATRARLLGMTDEQKKAHICNRVFVILDEMGDKELKTTVGVRLFSAFMGSLATPDLANEPSTPAFDPKASRQRINDAASELRARNKRNAERDPERDPYQGDPLEPLQ